MTEEERREAGFGGDNFRWATARGRLYRKTPEGLRDVTDEAPRDDAEFVRDNEDQS